MGIRDTKLQPDSNVAIQSQTFGLDAAVATSKTDYVIYAAKPGYEFQLKATQVWARVVAAVIALQVWVVNRNSILGTTAGLAIDSTPEKYLTGAISYTIGGLAYAKTASTAVVFTAAHVVTASKFGVILIQINASGTLSSKVPGATQTTAMAYATASAALGALPAATAGNVAIGYIAIAAKAATWTANTSDMTDGSDLTTATFNQTAVLAPAHADVTPIAGSVVTSAVPTFLAGHGDNDGVVMVGITTDGSGDITDAAVTLNWRPFPLDGEVGRINTP